MQNLPTYRAYVFVPQKFSQTNWMGNMFAKSNGNITIMNISKVKYTTNLYTLGFH
jgi:hypothetical protein